MRGGKGGGVLVQMGWGSYLFVHQKIGGCIKLCNLRGHVFLCLPISFPEKRNNTINNPLGNALNRQILGILATSVH